MSHSSTLITSRVSHRVSTSSLNSGDINMALASDTLFDKFGLFDNTGVHVQPSTSEPEYPGLSTLPTFENLQELDFAELLEIKEEPLIAETNSNNSSHNNSNSVTSNITSTELDNLANNVDPFFMDSPILDDASLDSIKSDCMWGMPQLWNSLESATALNNQDNSKANSRKRRRDVSLTLSECAEGLLAINHLDVNMFDSAASHNAGSSSSAVKTNPTLGSSPSFLSSSFGALDDDGADDFDDDSFASTTASEDEDESEEDDSEDEEEIIDVVSTDLVGSSARTRHAFSSRKTQNHSHIAKIEAGRSLLKKQFPKAENNNKINMAGSIDTKLDKQTSILSDHSYFLTRPLETTESQAKSQIKGMLTPNESSEDEDMDSNNSLFATGTPTIMTTSTNLVDKRKIAQAVQSLMKNRNEPVNTSTNIKFKFRMKFKSTMAAANTLKKAQLPNSRHHHHKYQAQNIVSSSTTTNSSMSTSDDDFSQMRERRKSASKNAFCPPPGSSSTSSSSSSTASNLNNSHNNKTSPVKKQHKFNSSISPPSAGSSLLARNKNDSEKCREIRDLHNSMERQRRVEQRNHLAYLKKQVPEVADVEKASKLTILRKAMEYCQLLANVDTRVRKERERELNKNAVLKKKLMELSQKLDSRRVTHSGRVASGWNVRY